MPYYAKLRRRKKKGKDEVLRPVCNHGWGEQGDCPSRHSIIEHCCDFAYNLELRST